MPTTEQLRAKLIAKLRELFQLNQPDLDFGFYRIMHAKAKEVDAFLSNSLPQIIEQSFGGMSEGKKAELQAAYEKAVETAKSFGAPDPEATEPVKKAKAALEATKNTARDEAEVYDHLYRFFERYYDNGDFVSLRYLTRETDRKAKPYAIPYGGEEVMLHWANSDQYYIKTAENFNSFSFDLSQAKEFRDMSREERSIKQIPSTPMKVHFKIVDAEEGEHGNVKANEERFFLIHKDHPFDIPDAENAELTVYFEYRSDSEKAGQTGTWQKKRNQEAKARVLEYLDSMASALDSGRASHPIHSYLSMLSTPIPTDSDKSRTLLDRYIEQYTARNTSDYFIHKDLGGFLKRELDFYIKNEIMQLDNVENADAPAVESYLAKIRVLRKIATQLIEFLAQLENFQKKLWLKKKFVVETNYCVTLDRVPKKLWPEVAGNLKQWQEWQNLGFVEVHGNGRAFATDMPAPKEITVSFLPDDTEYMIQLDERGPIKIDGVPAQDVSIISGNAAEGDLLLSGVAPSLEELFTEHKFLVIDTALYSDEFKNVILSSIDNFDEQCDGLLVHSENFQALNMLQERYHEQVKCIYIDPPYNTDASAILYKNDYKHSSWLTLMADRLKDSCKLTNDNGIICVAIDDAEGAYLSIILNDIFINEVGIAAVRSNPAGRKTTGSLAPAHEYAMFFGKSFSSIPGSLGRAEGRLARYPSIDDRGRYAWANFIRSGSGDRRSDRPTMFFPIYVDDSDKLRVPKLDWEEETKAYKILERPNAHETAVWPIVMQGNEKIEKRWHRGYERVINEPDEFRVRRTSTGEVSIDFKTRMDEDAVPTTWWDEKLYASANYGASSLKDFFNDKPFDFAKAIRLVQDCIKVSTGNEMDPLVLDFFAGAGTSGNAVINLNREDDGNRKYILVEMGNHFDTVIKPRIEKVVYSPDWKDGKPTSPDKGVSHCFKYLRLESYEDTLNNLEFAGGDAFAANPELHMDYLLHYMLDVETQGSASLLNIKSFANPFDYKLRVKKPGSEESELRTVDLLETFNYLIGLRVKQIFAPQRFSAKFERLPDPELPDDQKTKLTLKGRLRLDSEGKWLFRKVEGWIPKNRFTPNDGAKENILVIWRALTGDLEQDNIVLDEFFERECLNSNDTEFDTIYVNGSNNLPNLKREGDKWKVRLIEEDFMNRMWEE